MVTEDKFYKYYGFIKELKTLVVNQQKYESAAQLRDIEVTYFLSKSEKPKYPSPSLVGSITLTNYIFDINKKDSFDESKFYSSLVKLNDVSITRELKLRFLFDEII